MRILMLGNSFTSSNDLPGLLAQLTGAQVIAHTRGGARLSEQLNSNTKLGAKTQAALTGESWEYVVLQEMSHGPLTSPKSFFASVKSLCALIRENGATPVLYATWAYQKDGAKLASKGWNYEEMAQNLATAYRQASQENQTLLADVGGEFFRRADKQDLYAPDGVHPSELGTRIAAETLASVILQHKEDRS